MLFLVDHARRQILLGFRFGGITLPADVHPVDFHRKIVLLPPTQPHDLLLSVPPAPVGMTERRLQRFPAGRRAIVLQQELTPEIVAVDAVVFPEKHEHPQASDLLAGMEDEVPEARPDFHGKRFFPVSCKGGRPALRPAYAQDHPAAPIFHVEKGQRGSRRPRARLNQQLGVGSQRVVDRLEVGDVAATAPSVMHDELAESTSQRKVHRQDVLDDARVLPAGVLEVENPFDGRISAVLDGVTANLQSGRGIEVRRGSRRPAVAESFRYALYAQVWRKSADCFP